MRPGALRVVLVAGGLVSPTAVASEAPTGPSLHLEWSAPAACPRASEVRESASALLGARVVGRGPATTQVKARVRASARVFVLTIETRSPSGTDRRTLKDERCAVLAEAAAVIAAAAADPSLASLPGAGGGVTSDRRATPVPGDIAPEPGPGQVEPPVSRDRPGGELARELLQVRAASEALRDGRGEDALAAVDRYLRSYPTGTFVPEARLHRSEALCLLGRRDEARAAAAAFLRELPDSPLRARVSSVCAEK